MPDDPYVQLPDEEEAPAALLDDAVEYLRAELPGWEPSDAALEVAVLAAFADEGSVLYALLRERATDQFRDFGASILGVAAGEPTPASTTTTWTARDNAGYTIEAGTPIVVDAPTGRFAFEVVEDDTIAPGATVAAGVLVQALEPGSAASLADGPVLFDEQPAWVDSVTLDAPAAGGSDGEDDDEHLARIRRAAQLLSRAPILPRDFELTAMEVAGVARALVIDGYDDTTGLSDQERTVSIYPVDVLGAASDPVTQAAVQALIEARREANWIVRVGDPTYTTVDVDITVAATEGADHATVAASVEAAIAAEPLNPVLHGQPPLGEARTWRNRATIRRYEVAATADRVEGVEYVDEVLLAASPAAPADADVALTGAAPLPLPGDINVTVVAAT